VSAFIEALRRVREEFRAMTYYFAGTGGVARTFLSILRLLSFSPFLSFSSSCWRIFWMSRPEDWGAMEGAACTAGLKQVVV